MRGWFIALILLVATGCPSSKLTLCGDRLCPVGDVCVAGQCVNSVAIAACEGLPAASECVVAGASGVCVNGSCAVQVCGNGELEIGERCDDGNRRSGDGCTSDCMSTEQCGNGIVDDAEGCDCGTDSATQNPRCTGPNAAEPTAECTLACQNRECGDGIKNGLEDCDATDLAGATCQAIGLSGGTLACSGTCRYDIASCERCGDGIVNGREQCDGVSAGSCTQFGFEFGNTVCSTVCTPIFDDCGSTDWTLLPTRSTGKLNSGWTFPGGAYIAGLEQSVKLTGDTVTLLPQISEAMAVSGTSAQNAFFVGRSGKITHYDGQNASAMQSNTLVRLRTVYAAASTFVVAGGGDRDQPGVIVKYDGVTWQPMLLPPGTERIYAVQGTGPSDIWAGSATGQLLHFDGTQWTLRASLGFAVRQLIFDEQGTLWCAGSSGQVFRRVNGTFVATPMASNGRVSLAVDNGLLLAVAGYVGFRWDGQRWSQLIVELPYVTRGAASGNGYVLVTGPGGKLAKLNPYFWHRVPSPPQFEVIAAWVAATGEVFSGGYGVLQNYRNGAWTSTAMDPNERFESIWGTAANNVYAVSRNQSGGRVYHFDGAAWTSILELANISYRKVTGIDVAHVYVASSDGGLRMWNGTTWTLIDIGASENIYDIVALATNDIYVVGRNLVRHFDGATWTDFAPPGDNGSIRAIAVLAANDIWIFGRRLGVTYRQHYDGTSWGAVESIDAVVRGVLGFGPGQLFAIHRYGGAQVYVAGEWSDVRTPANESRSENFAVVQLDAKAWLVASGFNASVLRLR